MERVRAHVWVQGSVQGVNFRAVCRKHALQANVVGWVRNAPDGRVEAVFEGSRQNVEHMIDWCGNGPRLARVKHVEVDWESPTNSESDFIVTR